MGGGYKRTMPRPWRQQFEGAKYHITARGNGREKLFYEPEDYERVVLYAYALMSNHYHLLIETPEGNLSKFMQRLNTAYGLYFRYKRRRVSGIRKVYQSGNRKVYHSLAG